MFGILCKKGQKIVNRGEWQVRAGRKGSMACVLPQSGFPSLCTALLMPCISLKVFSVFLSNHSEYFPQIFSIFHIFQCIIMHTFDIAPPRHLLNSTIVYIWGYTCSPSIPFPFTLLHDILHFFYGIQNISQFIIFTKICQYFITDLRFVKKLNDRIFGPKLLYTKSA